MKLNYLFVLACPLFVFLFFTNPGRAKYVSTLLLLLFSIWIKMTSTRIWLLSKLITDKNDHQSGCLVGVGIGSADKMLKVRIFLLVSNSFNEASRSCRGFMVWSNRHPCVLILTNNTYLQTCSGLLLVFILLRFRL